MEEQVWHQVRALSLPPWALTLTTTLPPSSWDGASPGSGLLWGNAGLQHAPRQEARSALIRQELLLPLWLGAPSQ